VDDLVAQMGLLLSQLRFTRRAVEDIERNTARYGSFAFTSALAAGPRFGEPPIFGGALKVHVVNINDLAPGSGILEGLLGAIGRNFTAVPAGLVTGVFGAMALPTILEHLSSALKTLDRILERLGIGEANAATGRSMYDQLTAALKPLIDAFTGPTRSSLDKFMDVVTRFTSLFEAASGKEPAAGVSPPEGFVEGLRAAQDVLTAMRPLVDGLLEAIPLVVATLAFLLVGLDKMRASFADLLQFVAKNFVLIRGIAVSVLFDTIHTAATLGATVLRILGTIVEELVKSIISLLKIVVNVGLDALEFASIALQETINALANWLKGGLLVLLNRLAESPIFQTVIHLVKILPVILPAIYEIVTGKALPKENLDKLSEIHFTIKPPSTGGEAAKDTKLALPTAFARAARARKMDEIFDRGEKQFLAEKSKAFSAFQTNLDVLEREADRIQKESDRSLAQSIGKAGDAATQAEKALEPAKKAAAVPLAPEGLVAVAKAYEDWLKGGGLAMVLDTLTRHFKSPEGAQGIPTEVARKGAAEKATAVHPTIEIGSVIIELAPPAEPKTEGATAGPPHAQLEPHDPVGPMDEDELRERAAHPAAGSLSLQFPGYA
jgi:hypothetical protein